MRMLGSRWNIFFVKRKVKHEWRNSLYKRPALQGLKRNEKRKGIVSSQGLTCKYEAGFPSQARVRGLSAS
jgi:hypothetical protein